MKFTITRDQLQQGLVAVAASVPAKTTLPVLSNILVEATKDGLRLSGTDLDISVSTTIAASVDQEGAITLPAKKLVEIVRELPSGSIRVTSSGEQRVAIECNRAKFKLLGLPREEYPAFPAVKFDGGWKCTAGELQKLIAHVAFAASTEESRPILNGVHWELKSDRMRMVATNGHRLAKMDIPLKTGVADEAKLIVPPKALDQIRRLFNAEDEVEIGKSENHLGFRTAGTQIYTRLIEGPYPNYEQVIPKDNPRSLTVTRSDLMEAVDIVASHADSNTQQVRFSLKGNQLAVSSATADFGAGEQKVDAEYQGEDMDIGYNARYLLQTLRNIPTEKVVFRLKTALSAGIVEPVGALTQADEELLCLVMPLRLPDAG